MLCSYCDARTGGHVAGEWYSVGLCPRCAAGDPRLAGIPDPQHDPARPEQSVDHALDPRPPEEP
jgi:hypothetical protein